jgi:PAS domain S-box-containing protein
LGEETVKLSTVKLDSGNRSRIMSDPSSLEESMSLIVEASPNAKIMADAKGKIVLVNAQTEKLFGYTRTELLGQTVEVLVPEQSQGHHPGLRRGFHHNPIARPMGAGRDLYGLRKDGTEVPIEIGLNSVKTKEGTFVLASIIDITERKRIEETLIRERNLLRTLIDNLPDYIFVKDDERRFLTANNAMARLMGREVPDELLGKRDEDFYPEHASQEFRADEDEVFRGEPVINKEEPNTDKHGQRREILTTKLPLRDSAGKIIGLVGIGRDITELKQKEQALQDLLAEQEKLVASLQDALNHVKTLQGLLPICAFCHKIRNAEGKWERLETYISSHTEADFTHGFCPECCEKHYGMKLSSEPPPTQ